MEGAPVEVKSVMIDGTVRTQRDRHAGITNSIGPQQIKCEQKKERAAAIIITDRTANGIVKKMMGMQKWTSQRKILVFGKTDYIQYFIRDQYFRGFHCIAARKVNRPTALNLIMSDIEKRGKDQMRPISL